MFQEPNWDQIRREPNWTGSARSVEAKNQKTFPKRVVDLQLQSFFWRKDQGLEGNQLVDYLEDKV